MGRASPEFLPSNAVRPKSKPIIVVVDMGLKTHKNLFGCGFDTDPTGGTYTAPQIP